MIDKISPDTRLSINRVSKIFDIDTDLPFLYANLEKPTAIIAHASEDNSFALLVDESLRAIFTLALIHFFWMYDGKNQDDFSDRVMHTLEYLAALAIINYRDESLPYFHDLQKRFEGTIIFENPQNSQLSHGLFWWMHDFIISHELSHISLGHFRETGAAQLSIHLDQSVVLEDRHALEFDADEAAFEALKEIPANHSLDRICQSMMPCVMFKIFALLETFYKPETGISQEHTLSHPPPIQRASRLSGKVIRGSKFDQLKYGPTLSKIQSIKKNLDILLEVGQKFRLFILERIRSNAATWRFSWNEEN